MISYSIYTIISLGCSYALYFLLLRKQKTFQFNRVFLLCSLLLCLVAPFLEFEIFNSVPKITEIPIQKLTESVVVSEHVVDESINSFETVSESQTSSFFYIYLTITFFLAFRFLKNIFQLYNLTRQNYEIYGKLKLIKHDDSEMVSSFFNYVFINEKYISDDEAYLNIIKHETVHSKELHTLDIILIELLICMFWFNPFVWLYKKVILQNHEYIADDKTISSGIDIEVYSKTIINLGQKECHVPITSGFNFVQIKNRIIMLHKTKSTLLNRTSKIITVLLLFTSVFIFSSYQELKDPIVVVIDAGHGGKDSGQLSNDVKEKDIVLNISKYLKSLSDDKIKIITTRDSDEFSSLEERVNFINKQNADVVISLHCNNNADNSKSGIETYYYESDDKKRLSKSRNYSTVLTVNLIREIFENARINSSRFKILKDVTSPAVLLELGFLTNENDLAKMTHLETQKKIAKTIYDGIIQANKIK